MSTTSGRGQAARASYLRLMRLTGSTTTTTGVLLRETVPLCRSTVHLQNFNLRQEHKMTPPPPQYDMNDMRQQVKGQVRSNKVQNQRITTQLTSNNSL